MMVQDLNQMSFESAEVPESSLSGWIGWSPTSRSSLVAVENKLFNYIKTPFEAKYVSIPFPSGEKDSQIWTLIFNKESKKLPLVLVHGFAAGVGLWCQSLDAFAAQRPVYAFDLLGFGKSSRSSFRSTALEAEADWVQSIEEWRKQLGLKKFILLGHSMGGFIASSYALQYPDQVAHLILADPWGFTDYPGSDEIEAPIWIKWILNLLQYFNPLWILRAIGPFGPLAVRIARSDLVHTFNAIPETNLIPDYIFYCNTQKPTGESAFHTMKVSLGLAKYPMVYRLPALRSDVPITFIYGASSWISSEPSKTVQNLMPNSSVNIHVYTIFPISYS